ncbi:MAG: hypothetical protein ABJR05_03990 [Balneola sp.]
MKNLNKIIVAFTLIILVGSANILAQENANVAVTAQVEAALVLTPTDIALGTIQTGSTSTIGATNAESASDDNLGDTFTRGALQIVGTTDVDVVVAWVDGSLDNAGTTDALDFTASVFDGTTDLTNGDTVTLTGGDITLGVGGTLDAPSGTGAYSTANGTPIIFTITYD